MKIKQTLAQWFYSPGAYGLWLALDDPDNWEIDDYCAYYRAEPKPPYGTKRKAAAVMWHANGARRFDGREEEGTPPFLGPYERRHLYHKYKKMLARKEYLKRTEGSRSMLYRFTRLEDPQ